MTAHQTSHSKRILCVMLDLNWYWWSRMIESSPTPPESMIGNVIESTLALCSSYILQSAQHDLLLLTVDTDGSRVIYPSALYDAERGAAPGDGPCNQEDNGTSQKSDSVGDQPQQQEPFDAPLIRSRIRQVIDGYKGSGQTHQIPESKFAAAFAKTLCYINRHLKSMGGASADTLESGTGTLTTGKNKAKSRPDAQQQQHHRIFALKVSDDTTTQYMNLMNAFFTAQKMHIVIDAALLHQPSSLFEQAADISGGICLRLDSPKALLQRFFTVFSPSPADRASLIPPPAGSVDYRPACFCHQKLVDIAYVCSVCLSVFCTWRPICSTCDSVYPLPVSLKRVGSGANLAAASSGVPSPSGKKKKKAAGGQAVQG